MTRTRKKPVKRARKKIVRRVAVEQRPTTLPRVPFMGVVPAKPRGFWKRLWVAVFGE